MKSFETLSEAIAYVTDGDYSNDYNLHPDWIECAPLNIKLKPEEFHSDEVHRFE